jgi:hypothetical protein
MDHVECSSGPIRIHCNALPILCKFYLNQNVHLPKKIHSIKPILPRRSWQLWWTREKYDCLSLKIYPFGKKKMEWVLVTKIMGLKLGQQHCFIDTSGRVDLQVCTIIWGFYLLLGKSSALYTLSMNVAGRSWTPAGLSRFLETTEHNWLDFLMNIWKMPGLGWCLELTGCQHQLTWSMLQKSASTFLQQVPMEAK